MESHNASLEELVQSLCQQVEEMKSELEICKSTMAGSMVSILLTMKANVSKLKEFKCSCSS